MKNTTRLLAIVALSVLSLQARAQSIGLRGGLNLSNMLDKNNDVTYSDEYLTHSAYHLGVVFIFPLTERTSIESGFIYSKKGVQYEAERIASTIRTTAELSYMDIPLLFKVTTNFEGDFQLYGAAGPYLGIGIKGKKIADSEKEGTSDHVLEKVVWGNNEYNSNLRRLEYGLSFGGGLEYSYFTLGASYNIGLNNISVNQDNGTTIKNRVVMLTFGFRFGKFYIRAA